MKTEWILEGVDWKNKRAVVYTDLLKDDGTYYYGRVDGVSPYFYVPAGCFIPKDNRIVRSRGGFKSIDGDDLTRIYTKSPFDIYKLRDRFGKHFEADVPFEWRHRIDHGFLIKDNTRFFIDIEVNMGSRFVKDSYDFPITCMTCYDTKTKKYHVFTWRHDLEEGVHDKTRMERISSEVKDGKQKYVLGNKEMTYVLHTFKSETKMMSGFCMYFLSIDPDVVTAWNTSFDYPYILNRMAAIGMDGSILSPLKQIDIDKYDGEAIIKGRYVLDLLKAYRKIHIGQLDSFRLDDVGMFEFKVPKIKLDKTFEQLWKQDLDNLIEYNIADLEICIMLDEKRGILEFFEGISNFTGAPLDETLANSRVLDFYFLREGHERGLVMPSANRDAVPSEFEGAIVKEPVKGLHKNVACLDLRSVSGDTHIYIKCGFGFRHFRIDDFFKYVFSSDKNIQRLMSGYYKVVSSDDNGNVGWHDITNVIKHDNDKNMN